VTKDKIVDNEKRIFSSISGALGEWEDTLKEQKDSSDIVGLICIMDSRTYEEDLIINVPAGSELLIVAANWPSGINGREKGIFSARMKRPCVKGSINIIGTASGGDSNPGELVINGLMVDGGLILKSGDIGSLRIAHSTIVPGRGGIKAEFAKNRVDALHMISLYKTICGEIELSGNISFLEISDCIIQSREGGIAIEAEGTDLSSERSTILGRASVRTLEASNSIFANEVLVQRQQEGCVRFSIFWRDFRCLKASSASLLQRSALWAAFL
jgi:hypothetical protein